MKNPFPNDEAKARLWQIATSFLPAVKATASTPPDADTRRRENLARLVDGLRGPARRFVYDALVHELGAQFGEDLARVSASLCPGMVVVPLLNPNSHNYPLGKPLIYGSPKGDCAGYFFNDEGAFEAGNNLPTKSIDGFTLRHATPEELRHALENLTAAAAQELLLLVAASSAAQGYSPISYEVLDRIPEAMEKLRATGTGSAPPSRKRPGRRAGRSEPTPARTPASDPFEL